ncbi:hypothetical protein PLESTF_000110000 [Pleodorina starrii]|nr:hypothetical protein PLESTM_001275800 [Pleodorina starrii]GLC64022.1 hypothetical protein PLESTF_000110000 [Pleodorina starrii]
MFRGLKKAFSKGRSDVESIEATPAQSDEPVIVRPRSKSAAATMAPDEAARSGAESILSGLHAATPAGGNTAWDGNALSDSATPLWRRSGATALSASPAVASPGHNNSVMASATPGPPSKPSAAGTAWGPSTFAEKEAPRSTPEKAVPRPSPGKETSPRPPPRLGGLFRSGSSNARGSKVDVPTSVEPMVTGDCSEVQRLDDAHDEQSNVVVKNTQHAQAQVQPGANLLEDEGYPSTVRGGAMRTGSLMATPLAVEARRGPSVIS